MNILAALCLVLSFSVFADDTLQEIKDMSQLAEIYASRDLSCEKASDCLVLAKGAKACGGPRTYTLTSAFNPDLQVLKDLLVELTKWEKEYHKRSGTISNCQITPVPRVACSENFCSLVD